MYEEQQCRYLHMSLEEFKKWKVPEGWSITSMNAKWVKAAPSYSLDYVEWYFDVRVIIKKGTIIHALEE